MLMFRLGSIKMGLVMIDRRLDRREQSLFAERLTQEVHRASVYGLSALAFVRLGGDKTIGIRLLASARYRCNSNPSIPGIRTSRIRHFVSSTRFEFRNSSADEKASALMPKARTRYRVESAIEESSSTMQTRGASDDLTFSGTLIPRSCDLQQFTLTPDGSSIGPWS
jgi:hypothetical protein